MIEKDAVYINQQPKHSLLSIVVVGDNFPQPQEVHEGLFNLSGISDVIFIFSDKYFHSSKNCQKSKFVSLYNACGYIDSYSSLPETLLQVFMYDKEIFKCHTGIALMNSWNIGSNISLLEKINASNIKKPIYKPRHLNSEEYFDIYKKVEKINWIGKEKTLEDDTVNMYSTHGTESNVVFLRPDIINLILKFDKEPGLKNYISSFDNSDLRYFIASTLNYLGIEALGINIGEVEI